MVRDLNLLFTSAGVAPRSSLTWFIFPKWILAPLRCRPGLFWLADAHHGGISRFGAYADLWQLSTGGWRSHCCWLTKLRTRVTGVGRRQVISFSHDECLGELGGYVEHLDLISILAVTWGGSQQAGWLLAQAGGLWCSRCRAPIKLPVIAERVAINRR